MKRAILFLLLLLIMTAGSYAQNIQTIGEPPDTLLQSFVKVDSLLIIRSIADTNKTAVPGGIYIFSGGLWLGSADSHYVEIAGGEGVPGSGDIEGVVAGTGLSGGGTTGTVTLNLLLSARKGLEIDTDSLGIKVNGTTLITSSSGISANIGTASGTVAAGDHTHSGYISSTLASAKLLVGNGSNVATAVALSGDASLSNAGELTVSNDSHTHGTSTIEGLDISSDTNLSASGAIVLTGDALSHSTADGYVHIPSGGSSAQILQYSSAGTAKWITLSGDAAVADGGAVTIADSSHYHSVNDLVAGSSARFLARITNETGSGALVAGTSPTITGANLGVVAASTVSGQIQHLRFTLVAPNALVTAVGSPYNIPIWASVDSAITVTRVKVTCNADPTTELTGDVKYADAFIGLANAVVINDFDTATGVRDDSSISTASVAAGKCLYISFDAVPESALKTISFDILYYYQ